MGGVRKRIGKNPMSDRPMLPVGWNKMSCPLCGSAPDEGGMCRKCHTMATP